MVKNTALLFYSFQVISIIIDIQIIIISHGLLLNGSFNLICSRTRKCSHIPRPFNTSSSNTFKGHCKRRYAEEKYNMLLLAQVGMSLISGTFFEEFQFIRDKEKENLEFFFAKHDSPSDEAMFIQIYTGRHTENCSPRIFCFKNILWKNFQTSQFLSRGEIILLLFSTTKISLILKGTSTSIF